MYFWMVPLNCCAVVSSAASVLNCLVRAIRLPTSMGDHPDDPPDETFDSTDAGSSHTYPMEGGQIRKGGYIMIKGRPCKVSDVSTSKTGKHGHAKCHFVAIDIFTGKKMEVNAAESPPLIVPMRSACHPLWYLPLVWFLCAGPCPIIAHDSCSIRQERRVPMLGCG